MNRPARQPRGHRGFTIIELLIVIGIIALLAGIVGFAMHGLMNSQKAKATKITLQNLRTMLSEFEVVAKGLTRQPGQMYVGTPGVATVSNPPGVVINIWHDANPATPAVRDPLRAPRNVQKDYAVNNPQYRYQSDAVLNTQLVMGLLKTAPNNNKALNQMPAGQLMGPIPPTLPAPKPTWILATQIPDPPIVADAWGNPIIFVPSAGLWDVVVGDVYRRAIPTVANGPDGPITSKDRRPFWASAGPDGIFGFADVNNNGTYEQGTDIAGGDDNIYSFEE